MVTVDRCKVEEAGDYKRGFALKIVEVQPSKVRVGEESRLRRLRDTLRFIHFENDALKIIIKGINDCRKISKPDVEQVPLQNGFERELLGCWKKLRV